MEKKKRHIEHWQIISLYLTIYDIIAVNAAYLFALWIRFDCRYTAIPAEYLEAFLKFMPIYTVFSVLVFRYLRLYKSIWRFASFSELIRVGLASVVSSIFNIAGITLLFHKMPISYHIIGTLMQFLLIVGIRFSYRFVLLERKRLGYDRATNITCRAMIIGAGAAGRMILRDSLKTDKSNVKVCCIIDDNSNKWGRYIDGIPVVGGREDILANVEKYKINRILFAIPTATEIEKRDILNICKESKCEIKVLPGIYQLMNGEITLSKMRDVAVEDLLGRETIKVDMEEIFRFIKGKRILVTGGGGSIGSELCRQIAGHEPEQLIIFEIYENNAYSIEQELKATYPELNLKVLIGSVRDSRRINQVFKTYKPQVVYHAAAHKHVPLMETSPCEAIKNNVIGTYKTAYAALKNGCDRFVLISTDKAVNPTNIMGASKRLCEMVIQSMDMISKNRKEELLPLVHAHSDYCAASVNSDSCANSDHCHQCQKTNSIVDSSDRPQVSQINETPNKRTEFVAVRFGNVLGSNGSVIPLFKKQIEKGGPVTVTHPDIIRYFMTIPEAVRLVMQAGCYAKGGEIFVLDMGAPVKIDTLARNLIKLSGYEPDKDIKIIYTGLRPGEKLYEEKLMAEEGLQKTANNLIHIGKPIPFDIKEFLAELEGLAEACYENSDEIVKMVEKMVPTFHSAEEDLELRKDVFEALSEEVTVTIENSFEGDHGNVY